MRHPSTIPPPTRATGLDWPQRLVVGCLLVLASNALSLIPLSIGPLTMTMLVELGVAALLIAPLTIGLCTLDRRVKLFIFICLCMFVLSLIHLDGARLVNRIKYIFVSIYIYVLIVGILRSPGAMPWVRRLHLIPAYGMLVAIIFSLAMQGSLNLEERLTGNGEAVYFAVLLPICWTQCRNETGVWRGLNGMLIPAAYGIEVLSASRGGGICLLLASGLVGFIGRKGGIRWLPLVIAGSLLVGLHLNENAAITQRVTDMIESPEESLQERVRLWKAAILFTSEHPLLGGDFRANVCEYVSRVTWGGDAALRIQRGDLSTSSGTHNGYLATTAGFGVVVAAFYFAYFLGLGRSIRQAVRRMQDEDTRSYIRAGAGALLVWAVGMISLHIFLGWEYLLLWGALECALASGGRGQRSEVGCTRSDVRARMPRHWAVGRWGSRTVRPFPFRVLRSLSLLSIFSFQLSRFHLFS